MHSFTEPLHQSRTVQFLRIFDSGPAHPGNGVSEHVTVKLQTVPPGKFSFVFGSGIATGNSVVSNTVTNEVSFSITSSTTHIVSPFTSTIVGVGTVSTIIVSITSIESTTIPVPLST